MRKPGVLPPRRAYALRLSENEYELVKTIADRYNCKTFSEAIRFLILRETGQIRADQNMIKAERKLTTW